MTPTAMLAAVVKHPSVEALRERLGKGGVVSCEGVHPAAHAFLIGLLRAMHPGRPILVVAPNPKAQEALYQDLRTWLGPPPDRSKEPAPTAKARRGRKGALPGRGSRVLCHPAWDVAPDGGGLPHVDVISERLESLLALTDPPANGAGVPVVVTDGTALLERTFTPADLRSRLRPLKRGDIIDPLDLIEWLEDQGYEPEAQVTQKGTLALRGGIVDVFPPASPWPVRLEFFGNELESLRCFEPHTQIAREEVGETTLSPAGELGLLRRALAGEGGHFGSLLEHLPPDSIVVLSEPEAIRAQSTAADGAATAGSPFHQSWQDAVGAWHRHAGPVLALSELEVQWPAEAGLLAPGSGNPPTRIELDIRTLDAFRPVELQLPKPDLAEAQRRDFFAQMHRWSRQGLAVGVFCNNAGEAQRFEEIWAEVGPGADAASSRREPSPDLHLGPLGQGFIAEALGFVIVTDAEIFGRYKVQRPRRMKSPHAAATRSVFDISFTDFEPGDHVVHLQHGIGRYLGIELLAAPGGRRPDEEPAPEQECLAIEYAPRDPDQPPPKLYVPIAEAHLVSKYVGAGKARPPLSVLGGSRWAKAKAQTAEAVRDLAADLLSLQAARSSQSGHAFPPDVPWQREFESAFIYEETPDQLTAIEAAKRDLEAPRPMDRLICGDVGFGKTEVAIRAAFKAVMGGRQVAVLVPTTVLAQQHFNTFRERMADYPVRVELLSRFRTVRQQEQVVRELAVGAVDVVIGTHRLLTPDVQFKDLGLVVIDEEQRFGVLHKERLKRVRETVDVLTLSATPIPRTLYLALTGARDMSTIETPPQDRLPVETIVAPFDERLIRDAIERELARGGQVFFLHNRVLDIDSVALRLKALAPRARIGVGHGQMKADELEEVMAGFINGDTDVLLSTTIIESGIDIPNANTIIINRADRFGLSDLYQLRGRVGRYRHQAYAYLLLPRHASLLADARKRISAIRQFSAPGSGFKIAMRDLEIRGAGNLLGREQSGHITAVGFELYCQLLKESVHALKGEPLRPAPQVSIRLDFLEVGGLAGDQGLAVKRAAAAPGTGRGRRARNPASGTPSNASRGTSVACLHPTYVPEPQQRIELYRRLALARETPEIDALRTECRDRFGPLPEAVELLLQVAELRLLAADREVTAIEVRQDQLRLTRAGDYLMVGGRFPRLTTVEPAARLNEIRTLLRAL
ncbi:MAG: transcription-repair coupling factor [Verrucomicrobiales bacterium]|nr:transcription-repair coupling factor [Verrucomicrobiales bacterium]